MLIHGSYYSFYYFLWEEKKKMRIDHHLAGPKET